MHCDDKRTIFALKQCISDSKLELQEAKDQLNTETNLQKRLPIQKRISDIENTIKESNDQLASFQ